MNLNQLISICKDTENRKERLKSVTKGDMADILAKSDDSSQMLEWMKIMQEEMREIKKTNEVVVQVLGRIGTIEEEMSKMKKETANLREQVDKQSEIIKQQQAFLERLDQKERACKLIILGVPENEGSDQSRAKEIIDGVRGGDSQENRPIVENVKRIGAPGPGKKRPLLVTMTSVEERNKTVEKGRENSHLLTQGVRMKKDTHPAVRAEWKRLFDVKTAEEQKAENANRVVAVDLRKRQVTIDGQVIDTWKPVF